MEAVKGFRSFPLRGFEKAQGNANSGRLPGIRDCRGKEKSPDDRVIGC